MISQILALKIAELFCYMFIGVVMVRTKVLDESLSVPLARINVYLIITCSVLNAFQREATARVRAGLLLAIVAFFIIQIFNVIIGALYRRAFHFGTVDAAAVSFSNVGNLVIPLVVSIFGTEEVVYVCGPMIAFNLLWWTYAVGLYSDEKLTITDRLKKIFTNPNTIAVIIGACMFFSGMTLRGLPATVIDTIGMSVGPVSFFTMGVSIGNMKLKSLLNHRRVFGVFLMRMILCPLFVLGLMLLTRAPYLTESAYEAMAVVLLAASAPTAALVNQFAIMYDKEAEYANATVIVTTLLSIVTMPLIMGLYENCFG